MEVPALTVHGNWRHASSSADVDLEPQTITGAHAPFALLVVPEPAETATAPACTPVTDDDLGVIRPRAMRGCQHDSCLPLGGDVLPPPYADAELPAYSSNPNTEPVTLAMHLFKFGFLFPPFWVLGTIIWMSPLTAPAGFERSKSELERRQLVQIIRNAELRWAKRCAWALLILAGVVTVITIAVQYS